MSCAPSEDSDQPGPPPSLISLRFRMKKHCVISYQMSAQRRLIRLGGCPGWFESSLGAHVILLVLSCTGSIGELFTVCYLVCHKNIWAELRKKRPYSRVVCQPSKARAQLLNRASDESGDCCCLYIMCANREGSGETADVCLCEIHFWHGLAQFAVLQNLIVCTNLDRFMVFSTINFMTKFYDRNIFLFQENIYSDIPLTGVVLSVW